MIYINDQTCVLFPRGTFRTKLQSK